MKKLMLLLVIGFGIACGSTKMAPNTASLESARALFPDVTQEQLNNGQEMYETKCNLCHGLKSFDVLDRDGWKNIIPPMVNKVKEKGESLNADQVENLTRYLLTMSN